MPAFTQNQQISGKVTDSTGAAITGASIFLEGSSKGTTTDASGTFHLTVGPQARTLTISAIGYSTQRVPISGGIFNVTLSAVNNSLNEVVIIGYGTQQKKDLTGSISVVGTKDFQQGAITSPDQLIAGKVAGVTVTSNGGEPGSSATIRIRGISSLNSNNAP
jgi:iron complex outermembrane receptor protein